MATDTDAGMAPAPAPPPCARCKERDGVLDLRSEVVCQTCFTTFVASKAIKRLEVLQRETRGPRLPSRPQRYLLALSRGPSSTALLHILSENVRRQRERNQRVKFELVVAFVDIDVDAGDAGAPTGREPSDASPSADEDEDEAAHRADAFAAHFPDLAIHRVPLSEILSSPAIDWSSLPRPDDASLATATTAAANNPRRRLADLFSRLPSASARADVSRLLTRHALLAAAAERDCAVVLLGHTTTSLAELTLAEAAKGRGSGIPWLVNDGLFPLPPPTTTDPTTTTTITTAATVTTTTTTTPQNTDDGSAASAPGVHIYSPLREIFRKEIFSYLSVAGTPAGRLAELFPASSSPSTRGAVVSHRDLSLDDVVARYFTDVEASYPSVVANVVRTTGKLDRTASGAGAGAAEGRCGLCAVRLDPLGDKRWKGEIGDEDGDVRGGDGSRLCYGCERSVKR